MKSNTIIYLIVFSLGASISFGQTMKSSAAKTYNSKTETLPSKDTLEMLFGDLEKYWDQIDQPPNYGKTKVINEGWYLSRKSLTLLRYKYSDFKKRYEPIETDLLIGELNIVVKHDTIYIPGFESKILIKKLTSDTLIVQEITKDFIGGAFFIKSRDQKKKVIPAIKKN